MRKLQLRHVLAALAATTVMYGCGSSDSDNGPGGAAAPTTDVPATAQSSVDGLISYMNELINTMTNNTSEPVLVGDAVLPTSDTTEAQPLTP